MNKKQTIVAWLGAAFFLVFAWNPKGNQIPDFINYPDGRLGRQGSRYSRDEHVFDEGLTALVARLSSTVVVTSLGVYTLRDKKPPDEQ